MLRSRLLSLAPRCVVKTPRRFAGGDGEKSAFDYEYDESQYTGIYYYFNRETPRGRINAAYLTVSIFWGTVYYFVVYRPKHKKAALPSEK